MKDPRPKVVLRADAGEYIGFGHLVRTSALANYLRDDFDCMIACRCDLPSAEPFVDRLISEAGATRYRVDVEPDADRPTFDKHFLGSLNHDHITVLDNYFYDYIYQLQARQMSRALVSIHDMPGYRSGADVFFTASPLQDTDFRLELDTLFYGGTEWAFLREPFLRPLKQRTSAKIGRVVIGMGGADPLGITNVMIDRVRNVIPDVEIDVIAGPGVEISRPDLPNVRIHRNADAKAVADLLDEADFGIFPASTAAIEAIARRLPFAVGFFADNQKRFHSHFVNQGWAYDLGDLRTMEDKLEQRLRDIVADYDPGHSAHLDFAAHRQDVVKIFKELWDFSARRFL